MRLAQPSHLCPLDTRPMMQGRFPQSERFQLRRLRSAQMTGKPVSGSGLLTRNFASNSSTATRTSFILDLIADARNAAGAIVLVADLEWPPHAVTMRVFDLDEREVHSEVKGRQQEIGRRLGGRSLPMRFPAAVSGKRALPPGLPPKRLGRAVTGWCPARPRAKATLKNQASWYGVEATGAPAQGFGDRCSAN